MCLLIEDSLFLSTKGSYETQHTSVQHWKSEAYVQTVINEVANYSSPRKFIYCNRVVVNHRHMSVMLYTVAVTFIDSNSNETMLELR